MPAEHVNQPRRLTDEDEAALLLEPRTEEGQDLAGEFVASIPRLAFRIHVIEEQAATEARRGLPTIAELANALAVVFAYNESCASVAPNGSLTYGGEPTSYWRDRAEAVAEALREPVA
jgi:hypothetical protein